MCGIVLRIIIFIGMRIVLIRRNLLTNLKKIDPGAFDDELDQLSSEVGVNLGRKQKFKAQIAQVKKKNDNLLWIDGISYPFEIPYMIDNFKSQDLYALLVNINHTWYVREFTHEHKHITEIKI